MLSFVAMLLCGVTSATAGGQRDVTAIEGVQVGFDGRYRVGHWTPVFVTVRTGGGLHGRVSVTVPDGDGVPSRFSTHDDVPVAVAGSGPIVVPVMARIGRVHSTMLVEFTPDEGPPLRREFRTDKAGGDGRYLPALESPLVLQIGDGALGVEEAIGLAGQQAERRPVVAKIADVAALPEDWIGYEAIDWIVLRAGDARLMGELARGGTSRAAALRRWVESGGNLLVSVGDGGERLAAGDLAWLLPGDFEAKVYVGGTGAVESFAGSSTPCPPLPYGSPGWAATRLKNVRGIVQSRQGELPLVVRHGYGLGQVVFFAGDLAERPWSNWEDRPLLVARLMGLPTTAVEQPSGALPENQRYGYRDMSGQLRSALEHFDGVRPYPFWLVGLLAAVYVALIGPADYYLMRRLGRPQLSWFTFPLWIVLFCGGAWWLGLRNTTRELYARRIDVIDVDVSERKLHGTTWLGVLSPTVDHYDLELRPFSRDAGPLERDVKFSWLGLAGSGLGGMNPRTAEPALWNETYDFTPALDEMRGVPINVGATKSFVGRWTVQQHSSPLEANLHEVTQLPTGTITNKTGSRLTNCLLVYERFAYPLADLDPDETIALRAGELRRSELQTILTGRKIVLDKKGGDPRHETTAYQQASTDSAYILLRMSFFEAGAGRNYTRLSNESQRWVDRSPLLATNRAILWAEAADATAGHAATVLLDGQPFHCSPEDRTLIYRFVMPVRQTTDSKARH